MANHGVFVTEAATALSTMNTATSGIPFVIGSAKLTAAPEATRATAGEPFLATSFTEAEAALGYDDDWSKYTIYEVMYYHFKLAGCQPVIFLPLVPSGSDTAVTAAEVAAAVDKIDLCMAKFGIIPDLILAPGFSDQSVVAAAMATKIASVNGLFRGKAVIDVTGDTYTAAITAKNSGSFTEDMIVCWPYAKLGELKFHMSTVIAGRISMTDSDNEGVPYESPSNKSISTDGLCTSAGAEIVLTLAQANLLNAAGIDTGLNFMGGFKAWGNYTGCYPASTDVKDYFVPVSRMFDWVANTLIKTFWSKLDRPMNRRLIDGILDSCNIWLNGLVGRGYLLGARVEMVEAENPVTDLMAGIVRLHVFMTPPSPAQEIDFTLEYDASYVESALSA
jgi:phage tail sheath protein FI